MSHSPSPFTTQRSYRWWIVAAIILAALTFFWWRSGPGGDAALRGGMPPVPVRVATVSSEDMPQYLLGLGTVQPSGAVLVRSRVDGQLMKVHFTEGQRVKAGDLLAEIDPRPFQNTLREVQGQLARNKALLENAKRDLARYAQLSKGDFIAKQQVETQRSLVRQYEGVVRSDEAQVSAAALQLEYSRIDAPMDGTLGLKQVDEGNMIRASDTTGLVRITQTEPSDVLFTLPEADLSALMAGQREAAAKGETLLVEAWDRDQKNRLAEGRLLSIDNQIDTATGTVKLKARFANADQALFPNQFVNARLRVRIKPQAVTVPASAVQLGAQGSYVYAVEGQGKDAKVRLRKVTTGWRTPQETSVNGANATSGATSGAGSGGGKVEMLDGVKPGERVVIDGVDRLRDGAAVLAVE